MPVKATTRVNATSSLAANSEWVDRLLELFWTVDKVAAGARYAGTEREIPEAILEAYDRAETARQAL